MGNIFNSSRAASLVPAVTWHCVIPEEMKICCLHVLILFCIVWDHGVSTVVYTPDMTFVRLESDLLSVKGEAPKLFCVALVCILLSRCVPWPHSSLMPHIPFSTDYLHCHENVWNLPFHCHEMSCMGAAPLSVLNHLRVGDGA